LLQFTLPPLHEWQAIASTAAMLYAHLCPDFGRLDTVKLL
jgi:hypothetical protein